MDYFKLNHDGTLIRTSPGRQEKYMGPGRGWVHTQLLNTKTYTVIKESTALNKIKRIENPTKRKVDTV